MNINHIELKPLLYLLPTKKIKKLKKYSDSYAKDLIRSIIFGSNVMNNFRNNSRVI